MVKFLFKDMNITMYAKNFKTIGNNRGGSLKNMPKYRRTQPCFVPFTDMYIDYNGNVMPCCNFRSDIENHKKFILGNIGTNSLMEIFNCNKTVHFRKLVGFKVPNFKPCNECKFR